MTATAEPQTAYESWSILELMGHRRLAGMVREVQIAGAGFFRIDVPSDAEGEIHSTQFYPPSSVYCLTPVSEAAAKIVAKGNRPQPVTTWELPAPSEDSALGQRYYQDCGLRTRECECERTDNDDF